MKKGQKMTEVQRARKELRCAILDWGLGAEADWKAIERAMAKLELHVARAANARKP